MIESTTSQGPLKNDFVTHNAITYSGEMVPGSNSYMGIVWINGTKHACQHKHSGFTSAKGCADLRKIVEAAQ